MNISMTETRRILIWTQTPLWQSVIRRTGLTDSIQLHSMDELIEVARARPGSLAFIEVIDATLKKSCENAIRTINNPYQLCMVAIGDPSLKLWRPLLRSSGFAASILSPFDSEKIRRLAAAHFSRPCPAVRIEQAIEANLPWSQLRPTP